MWNPRKKARALHEIELRRNRSSTFTAPLEKSPDLKPFLLQFYRTVYDSDKQEYYNGELAKYPDSLAMQFKILVPEIVAYEDFWQRYEYRCNLTRVMEELTRMDAQAAAQVAEKAKETMQSSLQGVKTMWSSMRSDTTKNEDTLTTTKKEEEEEAIEPQANNPPPNQSNQQIPPKEKEEEKEETKPISESTDSNEKSEVTTDSNDTAQSKQTAESHAAMLLLLSRNQPSSTTKQTNDVPRGILKEPSQTFPAASAPSGKHEKESHQPEKAPIVTFFETPEMSASKNRHGREKSSLRSSIGTTTDHSKTSKRRRPGQILVSLALIGYVIAFLVALFRRPESLDVLCSPIRPGRMLAKNDVLKLNDTTGTITFEAPWWAPQAWKQHSFELLCSGTGTAAAAQPRTVLQISVRKETINVLVRNAADPTGKKLLDKRGLVSVLFNKDHLVLTKGSKSEKMDLPWR